MGWKGFRTQARVEGWVRNFSSRPPRQGGKKCHVTLLRYPWLADDWPVSATAVHFMLKRYSTVFSASLRLGYFRGSVFLIAPEVLNYPVMRYSVIKYSVGRRPLRGRDLAGFWPASVTGSLV